ncbi:MAG: hypothetical protein KDE05_03360 [Parvularculaceae bacterium]|nr:hypothetical protein [Parvularculaceae bacterium]
MSKGCWLVIIAIGLATTSFATANDLGCEIVGGSTKCENARNPNGVSEDAQDAAKQATFNPVFRVDQQSHTDSADSKPEKPCNRNSYDPSDRNCRDLLAQERMAAWTARLGWIGIFSVILLAGTLLANTWAVVAARKVGQAQARGYLSVTKVSIHYGGITHFLKFEITNHGQSPAHEVRVTGTIELIGKYDDEICDPARTIRKDPFELRLPDVSARSSTFGAVSSEPLNRRAMNLLSTEGIGLDFEISGKVEWQDLFGKKQSQPFGLNGEAVTDSAIRLSEGFIMQPDIWISEREKYNPKT